MARRTRRYDRIILFCLLVALCLALFPGFADSLSQIRQRTVLSSAWEELENTSDKELEDQMRMCREYNQWIFQSQQVTPFSYHEGTNGDAKYEHLLPYSSMCILDVPKANISLPVTHGTDASELRYEAGHMHGTSLPVGGESTHAVIAAHTGLVTSSLFDKLTDIKVGDKFIVTVIGEKHIYKVDRILIVLPDDESKYLQVEQGKDYITLYTCTPYGINDHRLLVRGIRDPEDEIEDNMEAGSIETESISLPMLIKTGAYPLAPILLLIIGLKATKKKKIENINSDK